MRFRSKNTPTQPTGNDAYQNDTNYHDEALNAPRFFQQPYPSHVTPYLGLRARLSQVWINRWTVLLLLVLARTLIAVAGLHRDIDSAKKNAVSACASVESKGSALVSLPHYMAEGVNDLAINGVEQAIDGLMQMLTLVITGVEEIVVFYINMLTSTYLCLITMAVGSSLNAAIELIESVQGFLNTTLNNIANDINSSVDDFESDLNKFISGLNGIGNILGGSNANVPQLNIGGDLTSLQNVHLPSNLDQDLQQLNNSIPTFDQVKNFTDNVIRSPFEEIKSLIANSTNNYTLDRTLFPVPPKQTLTFCSDDNAIDDFFQDIYDITLLFRKIAMVVLLILAIACCAPMAWREMRAWRIQQERAQLVRQDFDSMDVVYIVSHPYTAGAGLKISSWFRNDRLKTIVRWTIAYATTPPALVVLALGLAGLFSCLVQYILLKSIEKEIPALLHEVTSFADKIIDALNNESAHWANGTNTAILDVNNKLNDDVFGWVNISTHALNDTLNAFVDQTINVLNETFGGTVLYEPITEVFNCLIGLKIAGIEKGLTWVSDNAHVTFPQLPNNTFSIGAQNSLKSDDSGSSLLADAANDAEDDFTEAITWVATVLQDGIINEAWISAALVAVWIIILLLGLLRAFTIMRGTEQVYGSDGKPFVNGSSPSSGPSSGGNSRWRKTQGEELVISRPQPLVSNEKSAAVTDYTLVPRPMQFPLEHIGTPPVSMTQAPPYTATALHNNPAAQAATTSPPSTISPTPPSVGSLSNASSRVRAESAPKGKPVPARDGTPKTAEDESGNTYKNVPYTLVPKPMPKFIRNPNAQGIGQQPPRVRVQDGGGNDGNLGFAGARDVDGATRRAEMYRKSSHGQVSLTAVNEMAAATNAVSSNAGIGSGTGASDLVSGVAPVPDRSLKPKMNPSMNTRKQPLQPPLRPLNPPTTFEAMSC